MGYDGDDPTLMALQEQADSVSDLGYIPSELGEAEVVEEDAGDGRPAKSASRADWDVFAEGQGLDPSEYATKEDLIEALEE